MALDQLTDRFGGDGAAPLGDLAEIDVSADDVIEPEPAPPTPVAGQEPTTAPAPSAVDAKGVPFKNRAAEYQRKAKKARSLLESERTRAQRLEQENQTLKDQLATRDAAPPPARPAATTAPAAQPARATSYDVNALRRVPLTEWPDVALRDLKAQDASYAPTVDQILESRIEERAAQRVTAHLTIAQEVKTMDGRILSQYPSVKGKDTPLRLETARLLDLWGVDLKQQPLALEGAVITAARNLGIQPTNVVIPRAALDGGNLSVLAPDGDPVTPRPQVPSDGVSLSAEQRTIASRLGITDMKRYGDEIAVTSREPLIGRQEA